MKTETDWLTDYTNRVLDRDHAVLGWHFVPNNRRLSVDGNAYRSNIKALTVRPGYIYSETLPILTCEHGLHASKTLDDVVSYMSEVNMILCRVRSWGKIDYSDDKYASEHREVLWIMDLREVVKEYLESRKEFIQAQRLTKQLVKAKPFSYQWQGFLNELTELCETEHPSKVNNPALSIIYNKGCWAYVKKAIRAEQKRQGI